MEKNLETYYKKEERERLLGIIEMCASLLGDSSYENYARKKILELRDTIELNSKDKGIPSN